MKPQPTPAAGRTTEVAKPATQRKYSVVDGDVSAHGARAVAVWERSGFGVGTVGAMHERYEWFYSQNPQGRGEINFLEAEGEEQSLGSLGIGARTWVVHGEFVTGGVLVDFVVHPEHRTVGPALLLQREARARAGRRAAILTGIPDTKAVAIFKRLGSQLQRPLPRFVRVLGFTTYLRQRAPAWIALSLGRVSERLDTAWIGAQLRATPETARWVDTFDGRFDVLWHSVDKRRACIGVRDAQFLSWRFGRQPGHNYRTLAIGPMDGGSVSAYFVCELKDGILSVKDFLITGEPKQHRRALLMLLREARTLGASAVSIQVLGCEQITKALRLTQFVERDSRPFFAMVSPEVLDKASQCSWYVTQADEDI